MVSPVTRLLAITLKTTVSTPRWRSLHPANGANMVVLTIPQQQEGREKGIKANQQVNVLFHPQNILDRLVVDHNEKEVIREYAIVQGRANNHLQKETLKVASRLIPRGKRKASSWHGPRGHEPDKRMNELKMGNELMSSKKPLDSIKDATKFDILTIPSPRASRESLTSPKHRELQKSRHRPTHGAWDCSFCHSFCFKA